MSVGGGMSDHQYQDLRDRVSKSEARLDSIDSRIAFQSGEQIRLDAGFQAFKSSFEKEMADMRKDVEAIATAISGRNIILILGAIMAIATQVATLITILIKTH